MDSHTCANPGGAGTINSLPDHHAYDFVPEDQGFFEDGLPPAAPCSQ